MHFTDSYLSAAPQCQNHPPCQPCWHVAWPWNSLRYFAAPWSGWLPRCPVGSPLCVGGTQPGSTGPSQTSGQSSPVQICTMMCHSMDLKIGYSILIEVSRILKDRYGAYFSKVHGPALSQNFGWYKQRSEDNHSIPFTCRLVCIKINFHLQVFLSLSIPTIYQTHTGSTIHL